MITDADLRQIPRLRWHQTEDGLTGAHAIPERISNDELYFHGQWKLAIHYSAETRRAATARLEWWKSRLRNVLEVLQGDTEGIIIFEYRDPTDIPKEFLLQNRTGRSKEELDEIRPQGRDGGEVEGGLDVQNGPGTVG